jgi:hypothetical protein
MFAVCRLIMLAAVLFNLTAADALSEGALIQHAAAGVFQTPIPGSVSLIKKVKKKAKKISCDDLYAKAEELCGNVTCNGGSDCMDALCSPRWSQCGYKPKCNCQGRD